MNIITDLDLAVVNSDRDIKSATLLKRSLDVKGWIKPHICTPKNHTNPHNFLFFLDEQQQCLMKYRNWSSDAWMAGVKLLEVRKDRSCTNTVDSIMSTIAHTYIIHPQDVPEGGPSFLTADFSKLDLPKLMADAAKYPKAGVPEEKMDFWRTLDSSLHELHALPDHDNVEGWLSLVRELLSKKIPSTEDPAPSAISHNIVGTCVKDRQPIPEVCKAISLGLQ